jgi:hypothetical protein
LAQPIDGGAHRHRRDQRTWIGQATEGPALHRNAAGRPFLLDYRGGRR